MKQTETQYAVKHNGRGVRLVLVTEYNGQSKGRFENIRVIVKIPSSAIGIDRFTTNILSGHSNGDLLAERLEHLLYDEESLAWREQQSAAEYVSDAYANDLHKKNGTKLPSNPAYSNH